MRVGASMLIAVVLELPVDEEDGLIEVDILPAEPEGLLLPEAEREAD
jgi:hypothetical protein